VKWVVLVIALASILPLSDWLRRNPSEVPKVWVLMGFLSFLFVPLHLYIATISWPLWPGFVKGAELSILDLLALIIYFSLPRARHSLPFQLSIAFYFCAVLISAFQANVPMAALFYSWQLARIFLVYAVVVRACADERVAPALLKGMALGLCLEACIVIWERFGLGIIQTGGTFGHQNLLGLMSYFVVFPAFALLLAGQRGWLLALVPLAGAIIAVLTTSRGTIGMASFGYAAIFLLSALRRWTARKALVALIGVVAIAALAPLAFSSFERRFALEARWADPEYDERAAFEKAASMMLADHPMGVGANNYVLVANADGYNTRAGVAPTIGSGSANVHNVYLLVAAETGYLGLIAFVVLLLRPLTVAFRCGWRNRGDRRGDLLLGLGVALLAVYIHSTFEWIFVTFQAQYMFAMTAGLVAGLADQLGYWRRVPAYSSPMGADGFISTTGKIRQT
jgi:O-antigen ligase